MKTYERTPDVAKRTGLSLNFLAGLRVRGDGPPFIKVGGAVLYDPDAVDAWLSERTRTSTSEKSLQASSA